jgi:hypothetical protein
MVAKGKLTLTPAQFDLLTGSDDIELPADLINAVTGPPKSNQTREWIEPLDAVHWLSSKLGSDCAAKSAIAERLRDGAIVCCHVWMSKGPDMGPVSNKRPKYPVRGTEHSFPPWVSPVQLGEGLAMLGGEFWSYSDDWDADLKRWDWRSGVFVASREEMTVVTVDGIPTRQMKSGLRTRMVVSGIRFNKEDIDKIVGGEDPKQSAGRDSAKPVSRKPPNRGRTTPRRKKFDYGLVLARLESEIDSGEISVLGNVEDYGMQAQLEKRIIRELTDGDESPSESTARRRAAKLMAIWREHELSGSR